MFPPGGVGGVLLHDVGHTELEQALPHDVHRGLAIHSELGPDVDILIKAKATGSAIRPHEVFQPGRALSKDHLFMMMRYYQNASALILMQSNNV